MVGLLGPSPRELTPQVGPTRPAAARVPVPVAGRCWHKPWQEILKHSKADLDQSLWGLWVLVHTGFVWTLQASGQVWDFYSKHNFGGAHKLLSKAAFQENFGGRNQIWSHPKPLPTKSINLTILNPILKNSDHVHFFYHCPFSTLAWEIPWTERFLRAW